jgi:hypothetical protein
MFFSILEIQRSTKKLDQIKVQSGGDAGGTGFPQHVDMKNSGPTRPSFSPSTFSPRSAHLPLKSHAKSELDRGMRQRTGDQWGWRSWRPGLKLQSGRDALMSPGGSTCLRPGPGHPRAGRAWWPAARAGRGGGRQLAVGRGSHSGRWLTGGQQLEGEEVKGTRGGRWRLHRCLLDHVPGGSTYIRSAAPPANACIP